MNKQLKLIATFGSLFVLSTLVSNKIFAQTTANGIFFQAIARDNFSNPAKDRKIYVQSSIIQTTATGTKVLTEEYQTTTDVTGVFSISIGQGTRIGGTANNLTGIDWANGPYYLNLKVAITPVAPTTSWNYKNEWIDLGSTPFGVVPYALYAGTANGLDGKLSIKDTTSMLAIYAKAQAVKTLESTVNTKVGATDTAAMLAPYRKMVNEIIASNITSLTADAINTALNSKVNLVDSNNVYVTPTKLAASAFDPININNSLGLKANTTDVASNLALKLNIADTSTLSNRVNLKANTSEVTNSLTLKANVSDVTTSLATKVDKVSGKELSSNDYTTTEKTKLASITGSNTGDQDLSLLATTASVVLKANTTDVATDLALKASSLELTSGLATKVDKVAGKNLSTNDYSTTEKTKLAAITGTNTGDQDLSLLATAASLVLKANTTDVATDLALKENISNKSTAVDLGGTSPSDILFPTQKAVKNYVAANNAGGGVADGGITTIKIADAAVTDAKINTVSGSKVIGNITGNAANVTGTVALANGGTGSTSASGARINVGLGNVDNTTDLLKPISTAAQTSLDLKSNATDVTSGLALKAPIASPTFTGTVSGITKTMVGLGNADNTSDASKPVSTAAQTALDLKASSSDVTNGLALKANLASPTFTGTVSGITSSMVGLGNVNNTTDLLKPISTAAQTALDLKASSSDVTNGLALKANLASPTFTGTVSGIDKTMVGLGNADNTSDASKPVSTAAQTALDLKLNSTGNAATATRLATARNINGVAFDGSGNVTIPAKFTNNVTINLSGSKSLGKYANGATIPTAGKTLDEFLLDLVTESIHPSYQAPSVSISSNKSASYEIGTSIGSVILSSSYVQRNGGSAISTTYYKNSGALGSNTDTYGSLLTNITYSVTVTYGAGPVLNDNLGNPDSYGQIATGSTSSSLTISPFAYKYWGSSTSNSIDDATLRAGTNENSGKAKSSFNIAITGGTKYIFYAYPASLGALSSISIGGFESFDAFSVFTQDVTNASGHVQSYKIYISTNSFESNVNNIIIN